MYKEIYPGWGAAGWTINDDAIIYNGTKYLFSNMINIAIEKEATSRWANGVIRIGIMGKSMPMMLAYSVGDSEEIKTIIEYVREKIEQSKEQNMADGIIYSLQGVRGKSMQVYEDYVVIKVKSGVGSFVTGNYTDGEKTIYYSDCIGVQFKESTYAIIGYIQLETASGLMNNQANNFFNENTFLFDDITYKNDEMREVFEYIRSRIDEVKKGKTSAVIQTTPADEIKKYKELLDIGAITQEEYDIKKKELLGL